MSFGKLPTVPIIEKLVIFVQCQVAKSISCATLISFKIVILFNTTSADIKTKSADLILKSITILKEMRIMQLCVKMNGF